MRKITFYYPSLKIGGAQLLFIRCAKYLSNKTNFEIYYIDYKNGFSRKELQETSVKFIDYIEGEKSILLKNSVLITPLQYLIGFDSIFKLTQNNHFLFWSIHPFNIVSKIITRNSFYIMSKHSRKKTGILLKELGDIGVVKYMDYSNYFSNSKAFLFNHNNIEYLPIPIETNNLLVIDEDKEFRIFENEISFLWLSRLDLDKKYTLLTIMNELEYLATKYSITLNIVGDGSELNQLKKISTEYSYEIVFHGRVYGEQLDEFIDSKIDVGIAMGTSALEIAKRAKPVLMKGGLFKAYKAKEISDYIYLHEEYGFSLGSPVVKNEYQSDFASKVSDLMNNYEELCLRSLDYTAKNHLLKSVGNKLISTLDNIFVLDSKGSYNKINKINSVFNNDIIYRIISLLRKFKHKIKKNSIS